MVFYQSSQTLQAHPNKSKIAQETQGMAKKKIKRGTETKDNKTSPT